MRGETRGATFFAALYPILSWSWLMVTSAQSLLERRRSITAGPARLVQTFHLVYVLLKKGSFILNQLVLAY